jgi:hypothetical protein
MHGRVLFDQEIGLDSKRKFFLEAAEQGSAYALLDLGIIALKSKPWSEWDLEHVSRALTYIDTALRMGDYNAIGRLRMFSAQVSAHSELDLNRLDLQKISESSEQLLATLSKRREQDGFEGFALTPPVDVAKLNAYLLPNASDPRWLRAMVEAKIELQPCF